MSSNRAQQILIATMALLGVSALARAFASGFADAGIGIRVLLPVLACAAVLAGLEQRGRVWSAIAVRVSAILLLLMGANELRLLGKRFDEPAFAELMHAMLHLGLPGAVALAGAVLLWAARPTFRSGDGERAIRGTIHPGVVFASGLCMIVAGFFLANRSEPQSADAASRSGVSPIVAIETERPIPYESASLVTREFTHNAESTVSEESFDSARETKPIEAPIAAQTDVAGVAPVANVADVADVPSPSAARPSLFHRSKPAAEVVEVVEVAEVAVENVVEIEAVTPAPKSVDSVDELDRPIEPAESSAPVTITPVEAVRDVPAPAAAAAPPSSRSLFTRPDAPASVPASPGAKALLEQSRARKPAEVRRGVRIDQRIRPNTTTPVWHIPSGGSTPAPIIESAPQARQPDPQESAPTSIARTTRPASDVNRNASVIDRYRDAVRNRNRGFADMRWVPSVEAQAEAQRFAEQQADEPELSDPSNAMADATGAMDANDAMDAADESDNTRTAAIVETRPSPVTPAAPKPVVKDGPFVSLADAAFPNQRPSPTDRDARPLPDNPFQVAATKRIRSRGARPSVDPAREPDVRIADATPADDASAPATESASPSTPDAVARVTTPVRERPSLFRRTSPPPVAEADPSTRTAAITPVRVNAEPATDAPVQRPLLPPLRTEQDPSDVLVEGNPIESTSPATEPPTEIAAESSPATAPGPVPQPENPSSAALAAADPISPEPPSFRETSPTGTTPESATREPAARRRGQSPAPVRPRIENPPASRRLAEAGPEPTPLDRLVTRGNAVIRNLGPASASAAGPGDAITGADGLTAFLSQAGGWVLIGFGLFTVAQSLSTGGMTRKV